MRYLIAFAVLGMAITGGTGNARADERPALYNSSGAGGSTLYNATGGVRPLSLNQILQGRSDTGSGGVSRYSRSYSPYTSGGNSGFSSYDEIAAFRATQAEQARQSQMQAQQALESYRDENQYLQRDEQTQAYLNRFQGTGAGTASSSYASQPVQQRVIYKQRKEQSIQKPQRLFNSVQ